MHTIEQLSGAQLEEKLRGGRATVLLFSDGGNLRGEFISQFRNSANEEEDITFAQCDPRAHPGIAERFQVGTKPVLLGLYANQILSRSTRPWASDVKLAIQAIRAAQPQPMETETAATDTGQPLAVSDDSFQEEVLGSPLPVLVDFWAEWCGPCRMIAPILEKMAGEFAGRLRIAKVDVDANPRLAQQFRVVSIPTLMAFAAGKLLFNQAGALPEATLRSLCEQLVEYAQKPVHTAAETAR